MAEPPFVHDRYRFVAVEGTGALATVLRAHDTELDLEVAVKLLASNWALRPKVVDRFLTEAQTLRRLRSPSVVVVRDYGRTEDGRPFFVMDLASGGSLDSRLRALEERNHRPSYRSVAAVAEALGRAVGDLHRSGIVHRDLKPHNLLLQRRSDPTPAPPLVAVNERLLLGDLGLAIEITDDEDGARVGTRGYRVEHLDGVAGDLAAATGVLIRVLTGRDPIDPRHQDGRRDRGADPSAELPEALAAGLHRHRLEPPPTALAWTTETCELLEPWIGRPRFTDAPPPSH